MPLPEEYYNIVNKGGQRGITTFPNMSPPGITYPVYDGMFEMEQPQLAETGTFSDLARTFGAGAVSGVTWSAVDLESKDWNMMNTMEKTGWILGEGASLFLPIGPFGLLGKAGRSVARGLGNRFTIGLAKKAGDLTVKEADTMLKGINTVAKKTGQPVDDVIRGLDKNVQNSLRSILKDDVGIRWVNELGIGGVEAARAQELLVKSGSNAIRKAFKEKGLPDILPEQADYISSKFVKGLSEGRYVNDVAEWIERGIGGPLPEGVAKYLGMAAQDMLFMGVHSVGAGKIAEHLRGEEFDTNTALSHSALMSLAFPAIRLVPWGGKESLRNGIKAYWNSYKGTNYKKLADIHGEDTVRNMLGIMTRGSFKDIVNKSRLGDRTIKMSDGTVYNGRLDIEGNLYKMPMDHVYQVLNKYKGAVGQHLKRNWNVKYIKDLAVSSPRMGLGVLAMNHTIFETGAFNDMEGPELASHIFMSAIMTKGRGAWGRETQRAYMAEMTPYYEALKLLGANPQVLKDRMATYTRDQVLGTYGSSFATDPIGQSIEQTFDIVLNRSGGRDVKYGDFSPSKHKNVQEFAEVYNAIKKMRNPDMSDAELIDPRKLSKKVLTELSESIESIEVEGGKTIKQVGWQGTLAVLSERPAGRIQDLYGKMLQEMGESFGIGITYNPNATGKDKIVGQLITGPDMMEMDGAFTYNRVLQRLYSLGKADIVGEGQNISQLREKDISRIDRGINNIADKWMDVIDAEYGGRRIYNSPHDNAYMDFMGEASHISAKNFIRKVMIGDTSDPDAGRLSASMNALFSVNDKSGGMQRFRESIDDYKFEKPKNDGETALLSEAKETLRPLFELMKSDRGKARNPDKQQVDIPIANISAAATSFKKRFGSMPERYKENFYSEGLVDLVNTRFGIDGTDARAVYVAKAVKEENLGYMEGDKLVLPSRRFASTLSKDPVVQQEVNQALDRISNILGPVAVRGDFNVMETTRPDFAGLTVEQIKSVDRAIGNETVKDLLQNGISAASKIQFKNSNLQKKLQTIQTALEDVKTSVESGTFKTKSLDEVANQIETLIDMGVSVDKVASLESNLSLMRQFLARGDRLETTPEFMNDYSNNILSVQETVKQILTSEVRAKKEVQNITNKIINMAMLGRSGGGLKSMQAREAIEDLNAKLYELQPDIANRSKQFSDLIMEYNETGSWTKALDVVRAVNEGVVGQVLSNSRNPIISETAKDLWQKTLNRGKIEHGQRTLQDIAKEYGIVDRRDPNEIDPAFVKEIRDPTNPYSVESSFMKIRERIFENNKDNQAEAYRLWNKFIIEDSNILANALVNGNFRRTARIKLGAVEFNPETKFRSNLNDDFFDRLGITGNRNDGYDVWYLDGNISVKTYNKNRTFDIDFYQNGDPLQIQSLINKQIRVSSLGREMVKELKDRGFVIDTNSDTFKNLQDVPVSPMIYMRLSPGSRNLFIATDSNIKKLNSDFESWYTRKADYFGEKSQAQREKFTEVFNNLITDGDTNTSLRLKMLLQHIDYTRTGQFDKWVQEYSQAIPDKNKIAKIESDIYKRGYLSDGGTTQRFNEKVLEWNASRHPDVGVRTMAREILDNNMQFKVGLLADEVFTRQPDYATSQRSTETPFDNRRISTEKLSENLVDASGNTVLQSIINSQIYDVASGKYKSLASSMLDGAKIVDENLARLIWAQKGGGGEWNGAKTAVFSSGANSMLGKGFSVYIPEISREMTNRGINMMMGESSAKSFTGKSLYIDPATQRAVDIQALELRVPTTSLSRDWTTNVFRDITDRNIMNLGIEGLGVQFTSKNVDGINISSSMFDWQSPGHVKRAAEWMGLSSILESRNNLRSMIGDGPDFIRAIFAEKEAQGIVYTEGAMGLTRKMIDMGISSMNPLVKPQLDKMLRNEDYKLLTKVPSRYGEDNFIIPDVTGRLSNPIFSQLKNKIFETDVNGVTVESPGDIVRNKAIQFGGIAIPEHTARKKMIDLDQKIFVFRDKNGIDHVVQYEGKELNLYSPFKEVYDPAKHFISSVDANGSPSVVDVQNTSFQSKLSVDRTFKRNVETILNEVANHIKDHGLNFNQVHQLLQGREISVSNGNRISLRKAIKKVGQDNFDRLKPALGASVNAIPKIAKDQPVMRVDRINGNDMNGVVQVNAHDLRTTLQRDNDGDHLYTYLKVPHQLIKDYANDMGHKSDYNMFQKSISQKDINLFGIKEKNNKLVSGEDASSIGFSKYSNHLSKSRQAIGSIISSRRALSWMENAGLEYEGAPFLKQLSRKNSLNKPEMQVLDRMMDVFQNAVDIHGGYNRVMAQDALRNYFFWGDMPRDYTAPAGSLEGSHIKSSIAEPRGYGQGTNKDVQRLGFDIVLRTLNKANMMANDTWDTAGSRAPETWELQKAHRNIKKLLNNPTDYIAEQITREISRLRFTGEHESANTLTRQFVNEYYQKNISDVTSTTQIDKFYEKLRKGKIKPTKELWNFKEKADTAFEYSIGGKVLEEVMKKGIYNTPSNGDIDVSRHTAMGNIVSGIVDRVAMHRAFGRDPVTDYQEFKIRSMVPETEATSRAASVKKAITRGHIRTALQIEHRRLVDQLRFFNEEKFTNPMKLSGIESRLSDTADAIRVIDKQAAQDMVIDGKRIQIIKAKKDAFQDRPSKKYDYDAMVYEINGRLKKKSIEGNRDPRLIDYEVGGVDIDYGNLKPMWVKAGDRFTIRKGRTYLVDKSPIVRESASSIEAKYSEAWKQISGVGRLGARNLIADPVQREIFMYEVDQLRNFLDGSYRKTLKTLKFDRHFSNEVFDFASSKEQYHIDQFMKKWRNEIAGDGTEIDKTSLLMRYIIQPQVMTGKYISDGKTELPYYRVNKRLLNQMFTWGLDNNQINMETPIKRMIQQVEKQYRGERYEEDLMTEGYKYMNADGYRWENLGQFANTVRSLSNGWFTTPYFAQLESSHNLLNRQMSEPMTVRTAGGEKMRIKQRIPDNVFDKESANGKGCLY